MALTPIRRVVTGNDERGRSKVVWDGPSPGTHESNFKGRGHTDFWVWRETPPPLDGTEDAGAWHLWDSSKMGCMMAFDMISAQFVDGPAGTAQGNDPVMRPRPDQKLPPGVKPQRRIVTIDREAGKSSLVGDGPSPDVHTDP